MSFGGHVILISIFGEIDEWKNVQEAWYRNRKWSRWNAYTIQQNTVSWKESKYHHSFAYMKTETSDTPYIIFEVLPFRL